MRERQAYTPDVQAPVLPAHFSPVLPVSRSNQAQAVQSGFCGRCLNATLKNATFGCWSSNCFSRTGNDQSPMASNCSLLRCSCRLSYTAVSYSRVMPRASTGQASTHKPQNRQRVMSCLLYTSDAADERSSVDLGGRRIIKKKKKKKKK